MAAYPFAKAPTYAELKERLAKEFGCELHEVQGKIVDLQGIQHAVHYFERAVDGKRYRAAAPDLKDDERVLYSTTRSLCSRLRIDPAEFGLVLG
jgi:hypothetical protein